MRTLKTTGASTWVSPAKSQELHGLTLQVLGFLALFQACLPLMPKGGKFVFMSSGASPIDRVPDKTDVAYGITKVGDWVQ